MGGAVGVGSGDGELGVHVGELTLYELVVGDWGGELDPCVGVWEDKVEYGLH